MRSKLHQDPLPASNTAARWGRASRHTRERCSHLFGSPSQRESQLEYRRLPRGSAPQRPSATVALGGSPAARSQNRSALTLQIRPRVLKDSLVAEPGFRMFATRSATCLGYNRLWVGRNVDCDRLTTAGFLRRAPISCQTATGPSPAAKRQLNQGPVLGNGKVGRNGYCGVITSQKRISLFEPPLCGPQRDVPEK
jgi:hypothetical protein